jgi:hypothetical protein
MRGVFAPSDSHHVRAGIWKNRVAKIEKMVTRKGRYASQEAIEDELVTTSTSPRSLRAYRQSFSFLDNPPGATRGLDKLRKGGAVYSSRPPLPELPRTSEGGGWSRALVSCPPASPRALFFVRWD